MKQKRWIGGLIGIFLVSGYFYFRWSSAIRQPLDFSHAKHVRQNIPCSSCHKTTDSLPDVFSCISCHPNYSLPNAVAWQRVYRIAPDIIFSHQQHSEFLCSNCHQSMTSGRRWIHETRFPMDFCMKCHAQERAKNECGTCHKNR